MNSGEEIITITIPLEAQDTEEYNALISCIDKLNQVNIIAKFSRHNRCDTRKFDNLESFVMHKVPADWPKWSIQKRIKFWEHPTDNKIKLIERERICAAEIWCELLGEDLADINNGYAAQINKKLSELKGWERHPLTQRYGPYGVQRGFVRIARKPELFNSILGIDENDN